MIHLAAAGPSILALNFLDDHADWSEIVVVIGIALVFAAAVSRAIGRVMTWAAHGALGAHVPEAYRAAARRPLVLARLLVDSYI